MDSKNNDLRCHHFSHDHSLDYTKLHPHRDAVCSCCRQPISPGKFYYRCKLCGFYLHQIIIIRYVSCTFVYENPLHRHALNVEFAPVYDFQCDLCDKPSYSGWVYHCNLCEFDAHVSCVLTNKGLVQPVITGHVLRVNQRQDELMELLTRGGSNVPNNQDQSMQSFQLSEACFSIDFQNSLIGNDGGSKQAGRVAVDREVIAILKKGESMEVLMIVKLSKNLRDLIEENRRRGDQVQASFVASRLGRLCPDFDYFKDLI
ncbi:hypothetical protein E3N88_41677 [Mikania micrantha]|uniref:DC1 domain-containing protein n=1 Tax=Mikania micrantha TaxID=192012 RepID=A0A5N6LK09_9ASTR|nr:hypothetical protein E3N88_41677 [Mikania micrantha]